LIICIHSTLEHDTHSKNKYTLLFPDILFKTKFNIHILIFHNQYLLTDYKKFKFQNYFVCNCALYFLLQNCLNNKIILRDGNKVDSYKCIDNIRDKSIICSNFIVYTKIIEGMHLFNLLDMH